MVAEMASGPGWEPFELVRRVSDALAGAGSLDERIEAAEAALVPTLADKAGVRWGDEPAPPDAGVSLEVAVADASNRFGALRLDRGADRAEFTDGDRLVAEEVASRIAAVVATEERLAAAALTDDFLATLSHELRTPLSVVVGWIDLLRSGQLSPEKQSRALEVIDRNARVQLRLIEDLLDASRIVAGRMRLIHAPFDVAEVVRASCEALRPAAEGREVELIVSADEPATLIADSERLSQIVHNLVGNAIKFTPSGGRVEVAARIDGASALIEVEDSGCGIAPEMLPRIFERFWQGRRARLEKTRGLGIGLFITRHLVELQGGTIEARSDGPGQGAHFTVRLPLVPRPAIDNP
jgi:signal transduction histidine kinase